MEKIADSYIVYGQDKSTFVDYYDVHRHYLFSNCIHCQILVIFSKEFKLLFDETTITVTDVTADIQGI